MLLASKRLSVFVVRNCLLVIVDKRAVHLALDTTKTVNQTYTQFVNNGIRDDLPTRMAASRVEQIVLGGLIVGEGIVSYGSPPYCNAQVKVEAWQDGKVAHKFGNDYQKKSYAAKGEIDIHLAPGGGWAAIITK
jgi:hypothetical protein